jgi:hypothetical protein
MPTGSHFLKICTRCGKTKPLTEFYKRWKSRKNRHEQCRTCKLEKRREQVKERGINYSTEWRYNNQEAHHNSQDKGYAKKYGLPWAEYLRLVKEQKGLCFICKKPNDYNKRRRLVMDHDHKTKRFRGLICHPCNTGLGAFRDNRENLIAASQYLGYADYATTFSPAGLGC